MGLYKDGRPNGHGEMTYKNSIPAGALSSAYEQAKYVGNFQSGKRDGHGQMFWGDGSNFTGLWKHDMRHSGRMIMANGCAYEGGFKDDQFHSEKGTLYLPSVVIFEGRFTQSKTSPIGLLRYPSGDVYFG